MAPRLVGTTINRAIAQPPQTLAPSTLVTQRATDAPAPGAVASWRVELSDNGTTFTPITSDVLSVSITRGSSQTDGLYRRAETGTVSVELLNNTAAYDPTANPLVRTGVTVKVYVSSGTDWVPRFTGRVTGIDVGYSEAGLFSTVTLSGVDAVASLAQRTLAEVSPAVGAGDTASARVDRLLNLGGIGPSRDIDEGGITLAATTLGASVWDEIGVVVQAEIGDCWVTADGMVAFRPFAASLSGPVAATFSDTGAPGTLPMVSVGVVYDDQDLANGIIYSLPAGVVTEIYDDVSISKYSDGVPITLEVTNLPHSTQALADDWATLTLRVLSVPEFRIEELGVIPSADLSMASTVLDLDIGDRVEVVFTPPGAVAPVTRSCWLRGVSETVTDGSTLWRVTYRLASAERFQFVTFDDPILGALDTWILAPNADASFTGGRYVAVAGDLVSSVALNRLQDQMVQVFATLADAQAAIPSPTTGMQVQLTSPFDRRYWNGSSWIRP